MREADEGVGVGTHRARHVDEQHDAPGPVGAAAPVDLAGLAHAAQDGAQRAADIDLAAPCLRVAVGAAAGGSGAQGGEHPHELFAVAAVERGDVAVAQDLGRTGLRGNGVRVVLG